MQTFNAPAAERFHLAHPDAATTMYGAIGRTLTTLRTWHTRACVRRELRTLNDRMLADVGMSRVEVTKPFWQA